MVCSCLNYIELEKILTATKDLKIPARNDSERNLIRTRFLISNLVRIANYNIYNFRYS